MKIDQAKAIFSPEFVEQLKFFLINGNYGDFVTATDGLEIVEYLREINPTMQIEISTNGSAKPNIWPQLAELDVRIDFRLDGLMDTHHLYRQNTDFAFIIENASKFIKAGGKADWLFIVFDHNKHQIEEARQMSKDLGFNDFRVIDYGRNVMPVFTKDKRLRHIIGDYRGDTNFDNLYNERMQYLENSWDNIKDADVSSKIECYSNRNSEIYVTANGEVYPCCWLGFYPMYDNSRPSNVQLREIVKNNNALTNGLKQSIEWFNEVEKTWDLPTVRDGKIYECNRTCGIK
jgi:MoaA/NifB/PqqE/SkfB family radical SAM enzyme